MKKSLLFISIITCSSFAFCKGQNQAKHDINILYIVNQYGKKLFTGHLIILPKDIENLTVLSKGDALQYPGSSNYDVFFEVELKSNVKLLNKQLLLDTFNVDHGHANFPIQVDGKMLTHSDDILAEYAAISKIEVNAVDQRIEITTVLKQSNTNSNGQIIY
jgi:hypothetical protein